MIVGVDVSSKRIDLAWLENNRPCRWHQELAKGHLIDRLRSIQIQWPVVPTHFIDADTIRISRAGADVTDIAIEYPYAPQRRSIAALGAVVGIVTRQAPPWARVAWPSSGELRAAIGAKNTKTDAHLALFNWMEPLDDTLDDWDEHELDALTACLGWTQILKAQDAT